MALNRFLRRASSATPAEIKFRLVQGGWSFLEQIVPPRLSNSSSIATAIEGWGTEPEGPFLPAPEDWIDRATWISEHWSDDTSTLVAQAERIRAGTFDLLGFQDLSFGDPIQWNLDPLLGRTAPVVHWSRVPYLDPRVVGDHKVVWELNRHQHLVTLAQAALLTDRPEFSETVVDHVTAWISANDGKRGINWASALEVSFRAINWIWAISALRARNLLTDDFTILAARSLWQHGEHVERNLSRYFSPNTHLTGEALGLVYIGHVFSQTRTGRKWKALGIEILRRELPRQILSDGVYFEQASWYHRYTIDYYLLAFPALSAEGHLEEVRAPLTAAVRAFAKLRWPDRTGVTFGDDDGGSALPVTGGKATDCDSLALAAAVLGDPICRWAAGARAPVALAWLCGRDGVSAFDACSSETASGSHIFPDSGVAVLRDDESNMMFLDAGSHGALRGGHGHADALSVQVAVGGQRVFVDAGTHGYSDDERDRFRGTAAHNTLELAGEPSAVPDGPFSWKKKADGRVKVWFSTPNFDYLEAVHDGYAREPFAAIHERRVLFLKGWGWFIFDTVHSEGVHEGVIRYHCTPGISVVSHASEAMALSLNPGEKTVATMGLSPEVVVSVGRSPFSPVYGKRGTRSSISAAGRFGGGLPGVLTVLRSQGGGIPRIRLGPSPGVWCIEEGDRRFVLVMNDQGHTLKLGTWQTDLRCVLIETDGASKGFGHAVGCGTIYVNGDAPALEVSDTYSGRIPLPPDPL